MGVLSVSTSFTNKPDSVILSRRTRSFPSLARNKETTNSKSLASTSHLSKAHLRSSHSQLVFAPATPLSPSINALPTSSVNGVPPVLAHSLKRLCFVTILGCVASLQLIIHFHNMSYRYFYHDEEAFDPGGLSLRRRRRNDDSPELWLPLATSSSSPLHRLQTTGEASPAEAAVAVPVAKIVMTTTTTTTTTITTKVMSSLSDASIQQLQNDLGQINPAVEPLENASSQLSLSLSESSPDKRAKSEKHSLTLPFPPQSLYHVLIVVPGLGDVNRIGHVEKSLTSLQSQLYQGGYGFGCRVYVWNQSILSLVQERLDKYKCIVEYSAGMWTHHMSKVPSLHSMSALPASATSDYNNHNDESSVRYNNVSSTLNSSLPYTHVGVLMDDVDVSEIQMVDFLHLQTWSGFGVASPAIQDPIYPIMRQRFDCFFHRTDFVNILFAVFETPVWDCWQRQLIDTEMNPLGWGMDAILHAVCNTTLGVIDAHTAAHLEAISSYSKDDARRQMYEFIQRKVSTLDAVQYMECAAHDRPKAFETCQLYWDGTEADPNQTVDWACS